MTKPHFKPIPGHPGYAAGTDGQIFSLRSGCLMKGGMNRRGYRQVTTSGGSRSARKSTFVHTLIALTHIGPRPEHMVIDHANGDKLDNSAGNLQYMSQMQNALKNCR